MDAIPRALRLVALAAALVAAANASAADPLAPGDAIRHVGEAATVCGEVVHAVHAAQANGEPTFLNFGRPYPDQEFTALIWGTRRAAFSYPPESLLGTTICVRGRITTYDGKAQIVVTDPSQIEATRGR